MSKHQFMFPFSVLCSEIANPNNNLFVELPIYHTLFPNVDSRTVDHLEKYKFAGAWIAGSLIR